MPKFGDNTDGGEVANERSQVVEAAAPRRRRLFSLIRSGQGRQAPSAARSEEIADALAVHATIEERHFYPAVKEKRTEEILFESVEEHLEIKRAIADLLALEAIDETFEAKVKVLQEDVEHHVEEEENQLFPKVERMFWTTKRWRRWARRWSRPRRS